MVRSSKMQTKDFFYELPKELIAKYPVSPRDNSRLMVLNRHKRTITHHKFKEFPAIISSDYFLVFNKTRVFPARLKASIKNKKCELLLLNPLDEKTWESMVKPGKLFQKDTIVKVEGKTKPLSAKVLDVKPDGTRLIKFLTDESIKNWVESNGYTPLPPYIKNSKAGMKEYQTIYAKNTGSVAAPTAGLHFTNNIFNKLKNKNIEHCFLTLHVGRGTFLPVRKKCIEEHEMHEEMYEVSSETAKKLNQAKKTGKKILAVGTTSTRTLEAGIKCGSFHEEKSKTDIFIYPGYEFKATDALLTNFHLPESTLIMLISALAGKDFTFKAYEEAIKHKYRFYSFGDAMLIL